MLTAIPSLAQPLPNPLNTPRLAPAAPLQATTLPPAGADAFTLTPATAAALRGGGKSTPPQLSADTLHHTLNTIFEALRMDLRATYTIQADPKVPLERQYILGLFSNKPVPKNQPLPRLSKTSTIPHPGDMHTQPPLTPQEALGFIQNLFGIKGLFPTEVAQRAQKLTPNTVIKAVRNAGVLLDDQAPRAEKFIRSRRTRTPDNTTFLGVTPTVGSNNGKPPTSSSTDMDGVYGKSYLKQGGDGGIPVGSSQAELDSYSQRP